MFGTAIRQAIAALEAAGVTAVSDARNINGACVWVTPNRSEPANVGGAHLVVLDLNLVGTPAGGLDAVDALDKMLDQVLDLDDVTDDPVQALTFVLTAGTLPGYRVTYDVLVDRS